VELYSSGARTRFWVRCYVTCFVMIVDYNVSAFRVSAGTLITVVAPLLPFCSYHAAFCFNVGFRLVSLRVRVRLRVSDSLPFRLLFGHYVRC